MPVMRFGLQRLRRKIRQDFTSFDGSSGLGESPVQRQFGR